MATVQTHVYGDNGDTSEFEVYFCSLTHPSGLQEAVCCRVGGQRLPTVHRAAQ